MAHRSFLFDLTLLQLYHLYFICCSCQQTLVSELYRPRSTTPLADYEDVNSKQRKSEIFDQILEGDYDTKVRPPGLNNGSGPTLIDVSVYVRSIENIDDVKMEYSVQMTFRQEWIDSRIKYSHLQNNINYLQLVKAERIWKPDLFFLNEKNGLLHSLMIPNLFTRIFPNGRVLQSYRVTLVLSCIFNLRRFPMDIQSCPISMASYGWAEKDMVVRWRNEYPVQMAKELNIAKFLLTNYSISEDCVSITSTGNYSCIKLHLNFSREFGFYLIQIYIPCGMLVIVSWVSFWLEPTAVEARVSLGVTTILTIVTQTYGINQSAPPASYVKALDVWTAFCQGMVFGALLQFALVNYTSNSRLLKAKKKLLSAAIRDGLAVDIDLEKEEAALIAKCHGRAKKIDLASRAIFPCMFFIFNIAYWTAYL